MDIFEVGFIRSIYSKHSKKTTEDISLIRRVHFNKQSTHPGRSHFPKMSIAKPRFGINEWFNLQIRPTRASTAPQVALDQKPVGDQVYGKENV